MKPFSLLIKPAGPDCNLACDYCFYLPKRKLFPGPAARRMNDETLERMVSSYMQTVQPHYSFAWQGGEPTLMGADFFKRATALQKRYGPPGSTVSNGLQTNGTLLDEAMAAHFAEYGFLLGVSLDGPPEIHNTHRRDAAGRESHAGVMRGIELLRKHRVEFNVLVLVSRANVAEAENIYRYLRREGFMFHQYIPCVEFDSAGRPLPFSISGEEWGRFLCALYDVWMREGDTHRVSIRHFDSIVEMEVTGRANVCTMMKDCCVYFVVEHNGDIYPCDFFVEPSLRIGNVADTSWGAALESPVYRDFGAMKSRRNAECAACEWLKYCLGDCLKHRLYPPAVSPGSISMLCAGWRMFYRRAMPGFKRLAAEVRKKRELEQSWRGPSGAGRNSPCPCGSGRKYKRCCGAAGGKQTGPADSRAGAQSGGP